MMGVRVVAIDVPEGLVGDVGDVDHHAEAVHLGDDLFAEGGEAVVVGDGGIVDVAGGVGPVVGVGPGEGHVADAEAVVVAEEGEGVLDGVAAFDAHEDGEFSLAVGCDDLIGGGAELEFVRCAADLLEGGVDEGEGAAGGGISGVLAGVDPDGEELCVEVALLRGVVVEHAAVEWVGEVPVFVDEALRGVGVGVDDDGTGVDIGRVCHLFVSCCRGCLRIQKESPRSKSMDVLANRGSLLRTSVVFSRMNRTIVAIDREGEIC